MGLRISRALQAQLLAEAAAMPEREVCGLLFGVAGEAVTAVQPCVNVAVDTARTFEIDPASLIAAHRAQRAGGPSLIGCYHSHPNGPATPSPRDRDAAWDGSFLWLIIAGHRIRAWSAAAPGMFEEAEIEHTD